ncbi:hypothetical protein [Microbacterium sp. SA39]|uniref:hypothetical protein n=1 Tax=Microbacterium sp. SA39 TaxID=1263625 RepID=UPI0005F9FF8D|nr:hypothetical protein [Microbacterium sp. SA39]KJQ54946.1 hypothetical protein RS85_01322 [Microbacterium sp. SA39]
MTALPPSVPDAPASVPRGGHELPARLAGTGAGAAAAPRTPRRKRTRFVLGFVGGAVVIAALAITQLSASIGYDSAADENADAVAAASTEKTQLQGTSTALKAVADSAGLILASENEAIVAPPEAEQSLADAVTDAQDTATAADDVITTEIVSAGEKPVWFWELFGASARLEQNTDDALELTDDLRAEANEVTGASDAVTENGVALLAAAGQATPAFEAAHISARNDAVIGLRDAAADVIATTIIDETAVSTYAALQTAAAQVVATENEELAEKAGPLMNARLEVEAFARELAPGVLLEFDWAPIVNGAGNNGSMGGYTTWWWDEPDRSVIQLSNSVAEQWPAERSRALVAHEVGHAISVKCEDMYDSSTQDSIEKWATGWAISMGFTDDANGVWAYGYPPQSYIDAAAGCR